MQFFTAKVNFYDVDLNRIVTDHLVIGAHNFTEAMDQIEQYYGNDLADVALKLINSEHGFAMISKQIYETVNREADI